MKGAETKKKLLPEQREELLGALKARFEKNMNRHKGLEWPKVKAKLEAKTEKLWSLSEMERTGGEPDVMFPTPSGGRRSQDPPAALQPTRVSPNASERRAGQKQVPRIASRP